MNNKIVRLYKTIKRALFHTLFTKRVSAADADQNGDGMGDCYFVSSLAAIAEYEPKIITDMIRQLPGDQYEVKFYNCANVTNQGYSFKAKPWAMTKVVEDATLEFDKGRPKYSYTEEDPNEMWFPLVEKAYAQWKGGYDAIGNGGWPEVALSEITGRQGKTIYTEARLFKSASIQKDSILGFFEKADRNKYKVVCATQGSGEKDFEDPKNPDVYSGHAYSYHGYNHVTHMIRLRNPWGQGSHPEGFFDISVPDFLKYYEMISYVE